MSDELVEVWRQGDGTWRWRYRITGNHTELRSNRGYGSVEEALRSARQAYPGVLVVGSTERLTRSDGAPRKGVGQVRTVLLSAAAAFALLAVWAALRNLRGRMSRAD